MNAAPAIAFLRRDEWTMGNGQCPTCQGLAPGRWAKRPNAKGVFAIRPPHPCAPTPGYEGHKPGCTLAGALEALGEKVIRVTEGPDAVGGILEKGRRDVGK